MNEYLFLKHMPENNKPTDGKGLMKYLLVTYKSTRDMDFNNSWKKSVSYGYMVVQQEVPDIYFFPKRYLPETYT